MQSQPFGLRDVERVLAYFVEKQPEEVQLIRTLMGRGSPVIEAFGPVQMAVYGLTVQHGGWDVIMHSERGFPDWVVIRRTNSSLPPGDGFRPLGLAVFAWARAHGAPFRLTSPTDFDHELAAYGPDALDWLESGHEESLERLYRVWVADRHLPAHLGSAWRNRRLRKQAVARLEAAAG